MKRDHFSPETLDLFGAAPPSARRRTGSARSASGSPKPAPRLSHISDGELALLLSDLVREVQRRTSGHKRGKPSPDLDRAMREAVSAFPGSAPSASELSKSRRGRNSPEITEAKRKVVQAALRAGVKPTQVAKHFGVPLSALRQIGSSPAD